MGLKDLFLNNNDEENNETANKPVSTKKSEGTLRFPESNTENESFEVETPTPTSREDVQTESEFNPFDVKPSTNLSESTIKASDTPKNTLSSNNIYLDETKELYNSGLAKLNKDGVDFYEFYQSVKVNIDNTQAYQMAFNMCKAMNPNLTKESMVGDSSFYLTSLNDAYQHYKKLGEDKLNESESNKSAEEASLKGEVDDLEKRIAELTKTLKVKQGELNSIGSKYQDVMETIKLKLNANKLSMESLVGEINKVVSNIKNNL